MDIDASYKNLWKSPEQLRDSNNTKMLHKADIYSFGIVLYEVVGREGPWGNYASRFAFEGMFLINISPIPPMSGLQIIPKRNTSTFSQFVIKTKISVIF